MLRLLQSLLAVTTLAAAPAEEPTEITFMLGVASTEETAIWQERLAEFHAAHPDLRIRLINVPNFYDEKLQIMMAAGTPPDIFRVEAYALGEWVERGALLDLKPFYERDPSVSLDDYVPMEVEKWSHRGGFYGISGATETMAIFFNKDCFDRCGVPYPPIDRVWTWDEFVETAKALTRDWDGDGEVDQWGLRMSQWWATWSPFIWSNGGAIFSDDQTHCVIDEPPAQEAMRRIWDLMYVHEVLPTGTEMLQMKSMSGDQMLAGGRAAMLLTGQWVLPQMANAGFPMDMAPLPQMDAGPSNIVVSTNYAIFAGTKHPEAAWEAYKLIVSEETQIALARGGVVMPCNKSLLRPEGLSRWTTEGIHPPGHYRSAVAPMIEGTARVLPSLVGMSRIQEEALSHGFDRLWHDEISIEEATGRVARQIDGFLEQSAIDRREREDTWLSAVGGFLGRHLKTIAWGLLLIAALSALRFYRGSLDQRRGQEHRERMLGYLFVAPCVLGLLFFSLGPIVYSLFLSLCDWDLLRSPRFVGVQNYRQIFTADPLFPQALKVTAIYTALTVPIELLAGFTVALLMNARVRGIGALRTIYYLPSIVPSVATAVLWLWILNPEGLLNSFLDGIGLFDLFGIGRIEWLRNKDTVLPAIVLMNLWSVGRGMVIYLAGLQGIPKELYEAAQLDGAGALRQFWHVTLPLMSPVIFFNLVMGVIFSFQVFNAGYLMTQGGPDHASYFFAYYLYQEAFKYLHMGYANALAWILFAIILVLTVIVFRVFGRRVFYG